MLAFCIKRVNGLAKVKLVDAGFVWTEPHSKRIKLKLTIQKARLCVGWRVCLWGRQGWTTPCASPRRT